MPLKPTGPGGVLLTPEPTPAAPAAGTLFYTKAGGGLYYRDAGGAEVGPLGSGGSAPANMVTTDTAQTLTAVKKFTGIVPVQVLSNLTEGCGFGLGRGGVVSAGLGIKGTTYQGFTNAAVDDLTMFTQAGNVVHLGQSGSNSTAQISSAGIFEFGTRVVNTNDTRLTNSRTPTSHAASHVTGGSDPISVAVSQFTATGTRDGTTVLYGDNTWKVPTAAAPANMMTTDTTQFVTGTKTFGVSGGFTFSTNAASSGAPQQNSAIENFQSAFWNGAASVVENIAMQAQRRSATVGDQVLNVSADLRATGLYDGANRAYSNSNPPQTLMMTNFPAGSVPTPAAGLTTLFSETGADLKMRNGAGLVTTIGPGAGGGGGNAAVEYNLTQDWTSTTPVPPTTGITLFTRHRARRILAQVGPTGLDTAFQPALFSNRIARLGAIPAVAAPQLDHIAVAGLNGNVANTTGAGVAVTSATTPGPFQASTFYNSMTRLRYSTTAVINIGSGVRSAVPQWHLSTTANKGGFFFVARFGIGAGVNNGTTGNRGFVGLSTTTTALAPATNPSDFLSMVGFGWNALHTNLWFMASGTAAQTATHVNLGANFPVPSAATSFYEVRLFSASGSGQNVSWAVTRLNDGAIAQGAVTTALPSLDTMMTAHMHLSSGTSALLASLDVQSMYVESDN